MLKAKVTFTKCEQISQKLGVPVEHMVGRIYYWLDIDGGTYDLVSDIRLASGDDFMIDPIEVDRPAYYNGPINYGRFRDEAEQYFRDLIGPGGRAINIGSNNKDVTMSNNIAYMPKTVTFDVNENSPAW